MDIRQTLEELDKLFAEKRMGEVEGFLLGKLHEAENLGDISSEITILNELMGFHRVSSRFKDALTLCERVVTLMKEAGLENTIPYATTLLNVATSYRAAGKFDKSLGIYEKVYEIYREKLPENDFGFASLNNNMSLLYQEMGEYEKACACLECTLEIIAQYQDAEIEMAITHSNIALSLLKLDKYEEALEHIESSLGLFERASGNQDHHYPAALAAMGEVQFKMKNYDTAIEFYQESLEKTKANIGENMSYAITCDNLSVVYSEIGNIQKAEELKAKAKEIYEKINRQSM